MGISGAPQLLTGYGLGAIHAVPSVAKQTITYKTAAFEPVEADTPADTELLEVKEVELPKIELPTTYATHGLLGYPYGLGLGLHGLPVLAAPAAPAAEAETEE